MVSSIETIVPGTPVNCSATAKGCDKKRCTRRARFTNVRSASESSSIPRIEIISCNSWFAEEFSGRVFYDSPDGATYTAPYIDPGTEQASLSNWYENCFKQIYCADVSFPNDGTNQRGYVACALSNNIDEFTKFEGLFYYVHQNGRFQYPVKTARDYQDFNVNRSLLYNAPFERVQDYFVLFQNEDGVLNIH